MPTLTSTASATQTGIVANAFAADRDSLIMEHLPQVRLIARRIHQTLPGLVSLDDLVSSGTVGLISAIDHYDPTQGVKLRTYAEFKIRGSILDSLRNLDWAPRRQRRRARALLAATVEAENRLQTSASVEDIAGELNIPVAECHDWMRNARSLSFETLDRVTSDEDGNFVSRQVVATAQESSPSRQLEEQDLRQLLA
ncbi:MAG: sigma-70 family RNA polymerase sigma factor, partial [Bryobacteraceae bacterium]|nr:sigma-70 family RNA polymerase sigma factor [Bryobacteraceae bacterium]